MKRIEISFANRRIEFIDRDTALKQIEEFAERGTRFPIVIYGPEGCGKTALFKQAKIILEEYGYSVVHINPLAEVIDERFSISEELRDIARELGAYLLKDVSRLIEKAIEVLYTAIKRNIRKKIALLADDIFQAIGLDRAEQIVKTFLNMIEWPSIDYEKIVVLVTSSEGITRERIGRHRWAEMSIMWNMSRDGFRKLYEVLPNPKPSFEDIWRIAGGNPYLLERLYRANWNTDFIVSNMVREKDIHLWIYSLDNESKEVLMEVVENPDAILYKLSDEKVKKLLRELIEKNLIVVIWERDPRAWIDTPPVERDTELGISKYFAWQTPIHREAVRRALEMYISKP